MAIRPYKNKKRNGSRISPGAVGPALLTLVLLNTNVIYGIIEESQEVKSEPKSDYLH
jgi:hypothetical protein